MSRIFFGKISKAFPQQFDGDYYAGGISESSWYNGLEIGDFVFPIYEHSITKLWKVISFDPSPNPINEEGSVKFEVVKTYPNPITISTTFIRYKNFELDLNMLNKSVKSTGKEKKGFYPITCSTGCPEADQIDFSDLRSIYISIENTFKPIIYKNSDIRILLDSKDNLKILEVQEFKNNRFIKYDLLNDLYLSKNKAIERYTLAELKAYAISDNAINKEKFLTAVINAINHEGYYIITSPIALYDNILVGRKKSSSNKQDEVIIEEELDEIEQNPIIDYDNYQKYVELLKFSPNLILYGPPGTGKTYSIEKIIESFEYDRTNNYVSIDEIQTEGRISFITFHQSFSYEEFVEGLRPVISTDDRDMTNENGDHLKYKIQDGVLKIIANKAALNQITSHDSNKHFSRINDNSRIWKMSLGERIKEEHVFESCMKTNTIAIGWLEDESIKNWDYNEIYSKLSENLNENDPKPTNNANSINNFVNELQEGDLILVFANQNSIRAIGLVDGPYEWKKELVGNYAHRRSVKWLKEFNEPVNIVELNGGKKLSQVTLYELSNIKFIDLKHLLSIDTIPLDKKSTKMLPYYLIIDEINRGNISKIFGEMITLIEKDKRDKIKVILPYSQKPFSLPSNLFILGTMNTADRSIAVLDTALRRRFLFIEIEPSIDVIKTSNYLLEDDLDLSILSKVLNIKIAKKLDRDHRLGHSYFMDVFDIDQFKIRWYHQIIPLLLEYFYNDAESISEIISSEFIDKFNSQVIWIEDNKDFKKALIGIK